MRADLEVRHSFQFFLYPVEADRHVLRGDTHNGGYLFIRHPFEPKQHDGTVEWFEAMDAFVKHLHLTCVFVGVLEEVDFHSERNGGMFLFLPF